MAYYNVLLLIQKKILTKASIASICTANDSVMNILIARSQTNFRNDLKRLHRSKDLQDLALNYTKNFTKQ